MASIRNLVRSVRKAMGLAVAPTLDPRLAAMERVFCAPALTPDLVAAIKLISPHFDVPPTEKYRAIWEADQNGACWGEYEALAPLLSKLPKPQKVLEIGPGMGRSLVFFSKKLGWQASELHAYEGEGSSTKYTLQGPRFEDSFCGNLRVLEQVLQFNDIRNVKLINARQTPLSKLPGPYDFLYSFYCIGFHWSLEHFLNDLKPLFHERTVGVFTVPREFEPFAALTDWSYRVVEAQPVWPKNTKLKLLVLSKSALPG